VLHKDAVTDGFDFYFGHRVVDFVPG
jgi:hypothetical protein